MKGFLEFIRTQGVVGLAVGFILGGSVSSVVKSLVNDIINPLLGIVLGATGDLTAKKLTIGSANVMYGNFLNATVDFIIIALVVYFGVKQLGLDKLDKPK